MIGPNQEKVIIGAVTKGENLRPELASALLAAFQSERQLRAANVEQIGQLEGQVTALNLERDETLRIQRELETEIDRRVNLRTDALNEKFEDAEITRDEAMAHAQFCKLESEKLEAKLETAYLLIERLRSDLELRISRIWLRRIWKQRTTQRLLRDVEKQIPDLDLRLDQYRNDRE